MCKNERNIKRSIKGTELKVGSLNSRGIRNGRDQEEVAEDMEKYKLDILGLQEMHLKGTGIKEADGKRRFDLFYIGPENNKHHGVGIVIRKYLKAEFKRITDRTCMATVKMEKEQRSLNFIVTYAPTLEASEKNEEIREEYYRILDETIRNISKRNLLIIAGDMNAKVGRTSEVYSECMGRYGK